MAGRKKRDGGSAASPKKGTKAKSKATEAEAPEPSETRVSTPANLTRLPTVERDEDADFLVVGVGASAGGLDALGELFRYLRDEAMAYIVVQHLAPDHASMLTPLLARSAQMPVVTATDGMAIERNHVYVIPPNVNLAVLHGTIRTLPPDAGHGPRLPVDYLFRSLAQDQGRYAIGVVLSGTGTDGTLGLKAIKAAGGFTFAQDPATAKFDGMPRSAVASGAADFLPPKEIAVELARISERRRIRPVDRETAYADVQDQLAKLFVLIRAEFSNDLSQYKQSTIDRRIERRMTLHKMGRLDEYLRFVQQHPAELRDLYKDLLITVTSFFRDPEAFEALKREVFPRIIYPKVGQPARVWVPACATGEEAYSIAISLVEYCEERGKVVPIQIFATDIDEDSIEVARRGAYPSNIAMDVSAERLNRFFTKREDSYVISRRIRDLVVFSTQNILKDAPFSRVDLVSCRNFLIYLQPSAQKRVLRTIHYSLTPSGHLFLGSSESVGDAPNLFSVVDRKHKIFHKRMVASVAEPDVSFGRTSRDEAPRVGATAPPPVNLQGLADRKVLELYGPPGVVVNDKMEVLQFRGRTARYLDPVPGAASLDLLKIVRFELHMELKKAIQQTIATKARVNAEVTYHEDGTASVVRIDVIPLPESRTQSLCLLVLFHQLPPPQVVAAPPDAGAAGELPEPILRRIRELESELALTKDYLQTSIEERETTLEELQSANEEMQSSNEELQSTNEELETSKEEMQSTNEELTTVNEELQNRMVELSQSNDDLHNVLAGVDNAVVIVGMDLRVRRYTSAAERLFHLAPGDIGRTIGFLDSFLGTPGIEKKAAQAMQNLSTFSEEVVAANNRWYAVKITPYKTLDHTIRGVMLTLLDVDVRKRAEEMTRDVAAYAARFLGAIGHPLLIVDRKMRIVWANDPFLTTFQLSHEETVGSALTGLDTRQFADPGLRKRLDNVFESAEMFRGYRMQIPLPDGEPGEVFVGGSQIPASSEGPLALLSIERPGNGAPPPPLERSR